MPQPPVFPDFPGLDPLTASGVAVLSAQALYHAGRWLLGDRAQKERAAEGFEQVALSGVLFGLAVALSALALWGLSTAVQMLGVNASMPDVAAIKASSWADFAGSVQRALGGASAIYRQYADAASGILAGYAGAVAGFGMLPWTSAVSMAVMNGLAYVVTAATTVLISAAVYAVAAVLAAAWPALLPVGAVLVAYERTRFLGAWLLALSVVAPAVLAAGADALRSLVDPAALLALAVLGPTAALINAMPLIEAMVLLGLIGLTLGVLTYAASRLFDSAGASLSLE